MNTHLVSRSEWDKVFWRSMEILAKSHPETPLDWRQEESRRQAGRVTGVHYRPPSMWEVVARTVFRVRVKGESMEFKWSKASWKALRAALGSALAIGAVAAGEALLASADTQEELVGFGVPVVLVPILLALGAFLRNWLKHRKAGDVFVSPPLTKK